MSRSRDNADAVTTVPSGVGRNMIINGGMNVAQRSASVTGIGAANGYFTCDRWKIGVNATSAGRLTMTQTADGPNGISANCIKLDCTTADTSIAAGEILSVEHNFEGQNLQRIGKGVAGAKEIIVSFYVKANAAFTFGCELFDFDNSRSITKLFDTTTDWNRIELTFPADVDDGSSPFDDDNAASLALFITLHAGSTFTGGTLNTASWANNSNANRYPGIDSFFSNTNNNFFLTGVQMEVGPVATEFEQEEISTTLGKCQRYCQRVPARDQADSGAFTAIANSFCVSATEVVGNLTLPVTMRLEPTASFSGDFRVLRQATAQGFNTPTLIDVYSNASSVAVDATTNGGMTTGQGGMIQLNNDNDGNMLLDAEL